MFGLKRMREIELEEGEAPLVYCEDDDDNIDPDTDFSYIDKKIQDVLGQFQRDFMGEVSAENLGGRFDVYGSFLPACQNSTTNLTHPRNQSHLRSRYPRNMLLEAASLNSFQTNDHPAMRPGSSNDTAASSLPVPGMSNVLESSLAPRVDYVVQLPSVPGTFSGDSLIKCPSSGEYVADKEFKGPQRNETTQNSLRLHVKVVSDSIRPRDNSAIYSGLGLDMSPSSSLEDSPSEVDEFLHHLEEMTSPSCIIEIMTSFHVPAGKLISPLHGSLLHLVEYKCNLEIGRPGPDQVVSLSIVHETAPSRRRNEANREKIVKGKDNNMEMIKMQKDNYEGRTDNSRFCLMLTEGTELIIKNETASEERFNSVGGPTEGKNLTGLKDTLCASEHPFASSGNGEVVEMKEVIQQAFKKEVIKSETKELESDSVSYMEDDLEDRGREARVGQKAEKDKNSSVARNNGISNEVNEDIYGDSIKLPKQPGLLRHSKREEILDSVYLLNSSANDNKEADRIEKLPRDKKASSPLKRYAKENGEAYKVNADMIQVIKDPNSLPVECSMGNLLLNGLPSLQMEAVLKRKEDSSTGGRKKSNKSQTDGRLAAKFPDLCSRVSTLLVQTEADSHRSTFPSKNTKDYLGPDLGLRNLKDAAGEMEGETDLRKNKKAMEMKNTSHGPSIGGTQESSDKLKVKAGGKGTEYNFNRGPTLRGVQSDRNSLTEVASTSGALQTDNSLNWVLCEKCHKWRLLPYDVLPDSLPKKWICRMLDWLPGMNKCTFSEDETRNAVLARYHISAFVPEKQNALPGDFKERALINASGGNRHNVASRQSSKLEAIPNGEKIRHGRNLQNVVENSQQNPKKLWQFSDVLNSDPKNVDANPLKVEKKRELDQDACGIPKKMKRELQQFRKEQSPGNQSMDIRDGQNRSTSSSEISKDIVSGSSRKSLKGIEDKGQETVNAVQHELNVVPGNKRKLMDEHHSQGHKEISELKEQSSMENQDIKNLASGTEENIGSEHMKGKNKRRMKVSDFQEGGLSASRLEDREDRAACSDNAVEGRISLQLCGSKVPQKTADGRKSSHKDAELGSPADVTATSGSSKLLGAFKVKLKHRDLKSSPLCSIHSSPVKVSGEHDVNGDKVSDLHNEAEEVFPLKRLNSVPHDEKFTSIKSNRTRSSITKYDEDFCTKSVGEDFKQMSSGENQNDHSGEKQRKFEIDKGAYRRSRPPSAEDRIDTSNENLASDDHAKDREKSKTVVQSESGRGNAPQASQYVSTSEKPAAMDNADAKLPKRHGDGDQHDRDGEPTSISVSHRNAEENAVEIVEASSSLRKNSSHNPAYVLKEAKELKHSADRLKNIVPIRETAVVVFQAAIKFLLGASLSESGGTEAARDARNSPDGVCRSTGDLCEYWAREFEKCNDMALAALAYKCMEVAYMRVVYSNSVAASRCQQELQMALRANSQVDSPSSSASDVDNLNNQAASSSAKDLHLHVVHANRVVTAGALPSLVRLLIFAKDVSRAMEATRKSQRAFSDAHSRLLKIGNEEGISSLKRVLDFSFHDLGGLQRLVSLAMEALYA